MLLQRLSSFLVAGSLLAFGSCSHVRFEVELTWESRAPDGNPRQMVLINGRFPGPQLDLSFGDTVEFIVNNHLPEEATVHFHGIEQLGSPASDGVPGVSQKPIQPGESFVYNWTATQYGTYFYHGHAHGLIQDGLYGPIVIRPGPSKSSPFGLISDNSDNILAMKHAEADPRVVLISDWDKYTSAEYMDAEKESGLDMYCMDSILVNGKGAINCQSQSLLESVMNPNLKMLLDKSNLTVSDKGCPPMNQGAFTEGNFTTDPSKIPPGLQDGCLETNGSREVIMVDVQDEWASLNFIGAMGSKATIVSIDEHPMWVYAVDGVYIKPKLVDAFQMYNGERYSVMIKLDQEPGDYTIRIANFLPDQLISGYANLSYNNSTRDRPSTPSLDYGGTPISSSVRVLNTSLISPYNISPPSSTTGKTFFLSLTRLGSNWQWTMNNHSLYATPPSDSIPLLFLPPNSSTFSNPTLSIKNNTWVDLVLQVPVSASLGVPAQPPHPIHKHSSKGYIIGEGSGSFPYASVEEAINVIPQSFNLINPPYRDSFATPAVLGVGAWMVVRYYSASPGAWLLHCHVQRHFEPGGMGAVLVEGGEVWGELGLG